MTPKQFGAQIRMRRLEQHLTREELAEILWISNSHMECLECGEFEERDDKLIPVLDEVFDSSPLDQLAFDGFKQLFPKCVTDREASLAGPTDLGQQEIRNFLVPV
ncbi:MAG: helix-turn-helix domain-containing protein [Planctomycetota bacterium]